ncbi:hypothetical protein ACFY1S_04350 [Micromonospora sp. NPDC000663]|uniref:hypothetical protein n=1 Tax=Micromonospora sp. NPDC000663 TaxID=3364218 RepID=UPI00367A0129
MTAHPMRQAARRRAREPPRRAAVTPTPAVGVPERLDDARRDESAAGRRRGLGGSAARP